MFVFSHNFAQKPSFAAVIVKSKFRMERKAQRSFDPLRLCCSWLLNSLRSSDLPLLRTASSSSSFMFLIKDSVPCEQEKNVDALLEDGGTPAGEDFLSPLFL